MAEFEKGGWVSIYAQVVKTPEDEGVHPSDVLVDLFSHSDQYQAHVRKDWVRPIEPPEGIAQRCGHLGDSLGNGEGLIRCVKHLGHAGSHTDRSSKMVWLDTATVGYFEER
jgi:hypothetical protein